MRKALAVFLVCWALTPALVWPVSAGCISNCVGYGTIYDVCPSGCTYAQVSAAVAAASPNGCVCQDGADMFTGVVVNVTRTIGAITSDNTGTYAAARTLSTTATIEVLLFNSGSNITAVAEVSHLRFLKNSATDASSRVVNLTNGTWASGAGVNFHDIVVENDTIGAGVGVFGISGSTWNAGAALTVDRALIKRSPAAIGNGPSLMSLNATMGDGTIVRIRNTIFDAAGLTLTTAGSMLTMTNTSSTNAYYLFQNDTFTGLSSATHVFRGMCKFTHTNCAFYNPNNQGYEYDTGTANNIVQDANVTATYSAYSNLTAYAGTGNRFGLVAADFQTLYGSDFYPGAGSALRNSGAPQATYNYDVQRTQRPQGCCYDIGAFEYLENAVGNLYWAQQLKLYIMPQGIFNRR